MFVFFKSAYTTIIVKYKASLVGRPVLLLAVLDELERDRVSMSNVKQP